MKKENETTATSKKVVVIAPTRLPYHPALAELDCDKAMWRFLCESLYPSAKSIEGIAMALRYCKARGLDIMKKPVHVVPVYSSSKKGMIELVWPGIGDYRTTASRTGEYAGCDATECGPLIKKVFTGLLDKWESGRKSGQEEIKSSLDFHEWMRVTVYRIIKGIRVPFHGPKVYFEEIYSRVKHDCPVPNDRWQRAPNGQLEKCAEAAALRKAFPEEIGSEPTAEEMEGKIVDIEPTIILRTATQEEVKETVDHHLEEMGHRDKTSTSQEESSAGPEADADWNAMIDNEIIPGLHTCTSMQELSKFLDENKAHIENIGSNASEKVQKRIDDEVGKMVSKIKGKK